MNKMLQDIVTQEITPLGFELFELRDGGTKSRPVLDVRIDRMDGGKVSVDDCARASRAIEARLEAGIEGGAQYLLEVSSPGVERPLRNAADWRKFTGREAVITVDPAHAGAVIGSRDIRIAGVEGVDGQEIIVVEDAAGEAHRVPLAAVTSARLAFNWKR